MIPWNQGGEQAIKGQHRTGALLQDRGSDTVGDKVIVHFVVEKFTGCLCQNLLTVTKQGGNILLECGWTKIGKPATEGVKKK